MVHPTQNPVLLECFSTIFTPRNREMNVRAIREPRIRIPAVKDRKYIEDKSSHQI